MKWKLIGYGVVQVIKSIPAEKVEEMADKGLDYLEDNFKDVPGVIAGCNLIRAAFGIEDND